MKASTQAHAATIFLDKAIKRPLDAGSGEVFEKLLLVMEKSDFMLLKKLAKSIKQKLSSKLSQTGIPGK